MTKSLIRIEVPEGRLQEILAEIDAAQETIYRCYTELMDLGVLTVTESAASGN